MYRSVVFNREGYRVIKKRKGNGTWGVGGGDGRRWGGREEMSSGEWLREKSTIGVRREKKH